MQRFRPTFHGLLLLLAGLLFAAACIPAAPDTPNVTPEPLPIDADAPGAEPSEPADAAVEPLDNASLFDLRAPVSSIDREALRLYFRSLYGEDFFDRKAAEGIQICVYAAEVYRDGTLFVADFYWGGELAPDLLYVEDGAVVSATLGSDCWSLNYTRLYGDTIVYGKSFAWDNGPLSTTSAAAVFTDGVTLTVPLAAAQDDPQPGFLFVREGEGYLSTLTLYDGVRKVADQDSGLFSVSEFSDRFSENSGLTSWARFSPMLTAEMRERRHSDLLSSALPLLRVGEAALPLERHYADSGVTLKDLWRSLPYDLPETVEANAAMTFDCLPHDAAPQRVYLVALSLDDGSDEGAARACRECLADLVKAPSEPGCYAVLLDCGDVLFHALFKIA